MKYAELKCPFNEGDLISCRIEGEKLRGKIHYEDDSIFICQDIIKGLGCHDHLGYKYAWVVCGKTKIQKFWDEGCAENGISSVKLLDKLHNFEIGDRVEITNNSDSFSRRSIGDTFIIEEVIGGEWFREDEGVSQGVKYTCLKLVDKADDIKKKRKSRVKFEDRPTLRVGADCPSFKLSVTSNKKGYFNETKDESILDLLNKRK